MAYCSEGIKRTAGSHPEEQYAIGHRLRLATLKVGGSFFAEGGGGFFYVFGPYG